MREQPDFSTSPRPRRVPVRDLAALLVGLAAFGFAARGAWMARREAAVAIAQLGEVRAEVRRMESRLEAVEARSSTGVALLMRAAAAGEAPPERIVALLARGLPADARVESLSISYDDAISLELRVVARDAGAWDRTLAGLVGTRFLEEVTPGPERRDGEVRTQITARWTGGRP